MLARLVKRMRDELGIGDPSVCHITNFWQKSPRFGQTRFAVIGQAETQQFLNDKPVRLIWGVGSTTQDALERAGIRLFSDLMRWEREDLHARFGSMGERLWHLARGQDKRRVSRNAPIKSIQRNYILRIHPIARSCSGIFGACVKSIGSRQSA